MRVWVERDQDDFHSILAQCWPDSKQRLFPVVSNGIEAGAHSDVSLSPRQQALMAQYLFPVFKVILPMT
jgi:hypothetical protein